MAEHALPEAFALVGLGSNVDAERNLRSAVALLAAETTVLRVSSAWATAAVGPPGQAAFVNAAVLLATAGVADLRALLRAVESRLGRRRSSDRFAPRPIDLDRVLSETPRVAGTGSPPIAPDLLRHAHVAVPAAEVLPRWVHPESGETLAALAARLTAALPAAERPRRLALALR